jgi:hypothetical protein
MWGNPINEEMMKGYEIMEMVKEYQIAERDYRRALNALDEIRNRKA